MISLLTAYPGLVHDVRPNDGRLAEPRIPSRLEIQRRHLEHKKMQSYDLITMQLHSLAHQMAPELARKQMLAEARAGQVTFFAKIRATIARALIATGERIRPEYAQGEPKYNA